MQNIFSHYEANKKIESAGVVLVEREQNKCDLRVLDDKVEMTGSKCHPPNIPSPYQIKVI